MQENETLFKNTPYQARALKGAPLSAAHAQEALEDVLSDTSAFLQMPSASDILKVKSDSVYGVHKLIVTVPQGTPHPEYMLNARVAELEPKLVNVVFEVGEANEANDAEAFGAAQATEAFKPHQSSGVKKDISILTLTCSKLGVAYPELAALIGYEAQDVIGALSSGVVSAPMKKAIELYMENLRLKEELLESAKMKTALKEWLK